MADVLLTLDEVSKQLEIGKDQIVELVKKGAFRAFLDGKTYKFRPADVQAYKKKLAASPTTLTGEAVGAEGAAIRPPTQERKEDTSKIDLADIEAKAEGDDSDQTSVMAPADEGEKRKKEKADETPVFEFPEKDLGIKAEPEEPVEEGDQTSLLGPAEETEEHVKKETKPSFEFAEKDLNLTLGEEPGESVLVADESESSVDILEVTEESSSESGSSASEIVLAEESASDGAVAAAEVEESPKPMPAVSPATDKTVADILGKMTAEESEEELETLDLDEVVDTHETIMEEAPAAEELPAGTVVEDTGKKAETTETAPVGDEFETAGIGEEDATRVAEAPEGETAGVDQALAEAVEAAAGEVAATEGEPAAEEMVVPAGWEMVVPSKPYNVLMGIAIVMLALGGAFLFCEMFGIRNDLTVKVVDLLKSRL